MTLEQLLGIVRHALTAIGAILITNGIVGDTTWMTITGAITGIVSIIWSVKSKK